MVSGNQVPVPRAWQYAAGVSWVLTILSGVWRPTDVIVALIIAPRSAIVVLEYVIGLLFGSKGVGRPPNKAFRLIAILVHVERASAWGTERRNKRGVALLIFSECHHRQSPSGNVDCAVWRQALRFGDQKVRSVTGGAVVAVRWVPSGGLHQIVTGCQAVFTVMRRP